VRVLTWNVQGRVRSVAEQARALAGNPADVVALQEVRASAHDAWRRELAALGYPHVLATLPPGGENEIALSRRLTMTWLSRLSWPNTR